MSCRKLCVPLFVLAAGASFGKASAASGFTMGQVLGYPYPSELVASPVGGTIAWVLDERGVRNVWAAEPPAYKPRRLTDYHGDSGQELTNLVFSPDGKYLVFARGGDHDENWPAAGNLAPDPDSSPEQPHVQVVSVPIAGGQPKVLGSGDMPAVSADGDRVAFVHDEDGSVWWAPADGGAKPERLFYDRGKDDDLRWSPDGKALAFVSDRSDHSFIGIFQDKNTPIQYVAPTTSYDFYPRWSADGSRIAFVRRPGQGGAPEPLLQPHPEPWAIWVADVGNGTARSVWQSPDTLHGSYPETAGEANLHWAAGDRLVFLADLDGWPHLYSMPAAGGKPLPLTPGKYMVEDVTTTPDRKFVVYNANTGTDPGDDDRRHVFKVPVDAATPQALTGGVGIGWSPVVTGSGATVAFIRAGAAVPPLVDIMPFAGGEPSAIDSAEIPADFPTDNLVTPKPVLFKSADGWTIQGQLFERAGLQGRHPAVIFVHGGPPRQMLLGWHYMDYYSNSYAVNQYLANRGFVVLSVNYRLGIGYGYDFHHPKNWGPAGASEYGDVVAGARYLQRQPNVDPRKIGIWGGSYGGYLTALALARNSNIFKAGVDMHGVHDWSYALMNGWLDTKRTRYQQQDWDRILKTAWLSSPDADIAGWKSPVLLIQGDDDRNVHFQQTVDLARRLQKAGVPYEEIVIPNEIHGFLRYRDWLTADEATADFLERKLNPSQAEPNQ